ncbi:transketolase [compost metagenome]
MAAYRNLGNLCCVVDLNGSAEQILSLGNVKAKWEAFGWEAHEVDGHSLDDLRALFAKLDFSPGSRPKVVIAHTLKGKGVSMVEGHGIWHHRIPNREEYETLMRVLA